jgi:hypothetical protein
MIGRNVFCGRDVTTRFNLLRFSDIVSLSLRISISTIDHVPLGASMRVVPAAALCVPLMSLLFLRTGCS